MRTTLEMPDELLERAKRKAASEGMTMKMFFILAVEAKLESKPPKVRREPPVIHTGSAEPINPTPEQLAEAMF